MSENLPRMDEGYQPLRGDGLGGGAKIVLGCGVALVGTLVLALLIYLVIQSQFQTIHVLRPSMAPTLNADDFFVGTRIHGDVSQVHRGDIIVYKASGSGNDYIKRVIAGPGDRLKVSHASVTVNGAQLSEGYLPEPWTWSDTWNNGNEDTVPPNSFFVLGDNRNHSTDSRFLGYVPVDSVLVKATMRLKPRLGESF